MKVPSINTCEAKKGQVERLKRECRASRFPRAQIDSMLYIFFKFIDSKLKKTNRTALMVISYSKVVFPLFTCLFNLSALKRKENICYTGYIQNVS